MKKHLWAVFTLLAGGGCALAVRGSAVPPAVGAYVGASAVAFVAFALDKRAARKDRHRTPEARLHLFDLLGGWPGALIARPLFRHKTKKQPFTAILYATVALHVAAWLALAWWLTAPGE